MESGIIVYKKVVPGANLGETIERCLELYEDKLLAGLSSEDNETRDLASKAFEIEKMMARHSDSFLPDRFKGKGYSRLRSAYAFPFEFPESWFYPNLVPQQNSFAEGETVMRMEVDGTSALVLPMYVVSGLYRHNHSWNEQRDMRTVEEYWASAVTLEEFAREFENPRSREYVWFSKDGTRRIQTPEVIIPEWDLGKVSFVDVPEK